MENFADSDIFQTTNRFRIFDKVLTVPPFTPLPFTDSKMHSSFLSFSYRWFSHTLRDSRKGSGYVEREGGHTHYLIIDQKQICIWIWITLIGVLASRAIIGIVLLTKVSVCDCALFFWVFVKFHPPPPRLTLFVFRVIGFGWGRGAFLAQTPGIIWAGSVILLNNHCIALCRRQHTRGCR